MQFSHHILLQLRLSFQGHLSGLLRALRPDFSRRDGLCVIQRESQQGTILLDHVRYRTVPPVALTYAV
jgi:hypothetical protein